MVGGEAGGASDLGLAVDARDRPSDRGGQAHVDASCPPTTASGRVSVFEPGELGPVSRTASAASASCRWRTERVPTIAMGANGWLITQARATWVAERPRACPNSIARRGEPRFRGSGRRRTSGTTGRPRARNSHSLSEPGEQAGRVTQNQARDASSVASTTPGHGSPTGRASDRIAAPRDRRPGVDRRVGRGLVQSCDRPVRDAEGAGSSRRDRLGQRVEDLADRDRAVVTMDEVDVDGVDAEPLQALAEVSRDGRGHPAGPIAFVGMGALGQQDDILPAAPRAGRRRWRTRSRHARRRRGVDEAPAGSPPGVQHADATSCWSARRATVPSARGLIRSLDVMGHSRRGRLLS